MNKFRLLVVLFFLSLNTLFSQKKDTVNYIYYEHQDFYLVFNKSHCEYTCDAEYETVFNLNNSSFNFPYGFSFTDILILPKGDLVISDYYSGVFYVADSGNETEGPFCF